MPGEKIYMPYVENSNSYVGDNKSTSELVTLT